MSDIKIHKSNNLNHYLKEVYVILCCGEKFSFYRN